MTKKLSLILCGLLLASAVHAQDVDAGKQLLYNERYAGAEAYFHNLLQKDPENEDAWLALTEAYIQQGEARQALDSLDKAPEDAKEEWSWMLAKAGALMATKKMAEANEIFESAISKTKSKNAEVLATIAKWHVVLDNGNPDYALELLEKALKRSRKNPEINYLQGLAYRNKVMGTEAYQAFREAINKDEDFAPAYYELGRIFLTQKNVDVYTDYFQKAIKANPSFAPAHYRLYVHYQAIQPEKAKMHFMHFRNNTDRNIQQEYDYTDLLYLNKQYDSAIARAQQLITLQGEQVKPRLYKLISYAKQGLQDTASAIAQMQLYFKNEEDSNLLVKDFETMGILFATEENKYDSAMHYMAIAAERTEDSADLRNYYQTLAAWAKQKDDPAAEAKWLGKYYLSDANASNVTLFNWGLAAYKAEDYLQADTVFALYAEKYPEQGYGYYWRARANAAIDTAMEWGLAIPHYQSLINLLDKPLDSLSAGDKKWLSESYMYLASYEVNTNKDYDAAIDWFTKLLEVDPANETASQYIKLLEENIKASQATGTENKSGAAEEEAPEGASRE